MLRAGSPIESSENGAATEAPLAVTLEWAGDLSPVRRMAAFELVLAFFTAAVVLIVLTAFAVVLGTLVIQGLTLKPLLRALDLHDGDPVRREVHAARGRALDAALASLGDDRSFLANVVREELRANLAAESAADEASAAARHSLTDLHHSAVQAAREAVLAMRARDEIGDDAFHLVEEELDWLEMAGQRSDE